MALVNRKVLEKKQSKKISQAIIDSRYDSKYFENKENLLKRIDRERDLNYYNDF